jgi:hypothetical protein
VNARREATRRLERDGDGFIAMASIIFVAMAQVQPLGRNVEANRRYAHCHTAR